MRSCYTVLAVFALGWLPAASPPASAAPSEVFVAMGCRAITDEQSWEFHTVQGGLAINCADTSNQGSAKSSASMDAGGDGYSAYGYVTARANLAANAFFVEAAASVGAVVGIELVPYVQPPWNPDLLPVDLRTMGYGETSDGGFGHATVGLDFGVPLYSHDWSGDDPGSEAHGELEMWVDAQSGGFNVVKGVSCLAQAFATTVDGQPVRRDSARCVITFDPYAVFDQARFDALWGDQSFRLDSYYRLSPSRPARVFEVPLPGSLGLALAALSVLAMRRRTCGARPQRGLLSRGLMLVVPLIPPAMAQSAFDPLTGLSVSQPPLPALVGAGDGTEFSVTATARPGVSIVGYTWKRDGRKLGTTSKSKTLRLTGLTPAQSGQITVDIIGTRGTLTTTPVALRVVPTGWAPLSGRALPGTAALQAPALTLCGQAHVAWVLQGSPHGQLQVHRFDGAAWQPPGAAATVSTGGLDAGEPSLQCGSVDGPAPVVAFSQAAAGGRSIEVRLLQQGQWLAVGQVPVVAGVDARAPLLRLVPTPETLPPSALRQHIEAGSRLAWRGGGTVRTATWGGSWQSGIAAAHQAPRHGLALDTASRGPQGLLHPWLLATTSPVAQGIHRGRYRPRVETDRHGAWMPVGEPVGAPAPPATSQQLVGLGFTAVENSRPRAVVVWVEGQTGYTIKSSTLFSADYEDAVAVSTHVVPWQTYAADLQGNDLQAWAFDPQGFEENCQPAPPAGFALALSDRRDTRVLRTDCSAAGLPRWAGFVPALPTHALALDLKMTDWQSPLVATVSNGPKGRELTVWKYYR